MGALAMSYAGTIGTSTWAYRQTAGGDSGLGVAQKAVDRLRMVGRELNFFSFGKIRNGNGYTLPINDVLPIPGMALGITTPRTVRAGAQREHEFLEAFLAAADIATEMVAADEMDAPDPGIWASAVMALRPFAPYLSAPLVNPLQLGGVSCEWHEHGINLELRFRASGDVYAVIEDARGELADFHGRDSALRQAANALRALWRRQR